MGLPDFVLENKKRLFTVVLFVVVVVVFAGLGYYKLFYKADVKLEITGTVYYVSTDDPAASDSNVGTDDRAPFKTIEHARDVARSFLVNNHTDNVTVLIRAGTYRPSQTIALTSRDSGQGNQHVTYRSYGGERVVMSGSKELTGWAPVDGKPGMFSANTNNLGIATDFTISSLYSNENKLTVAQEPDLVAPDFSRDDPYAGNWLFTSTANRSCADSTDPVLLSNRTDLKYNATDISASMVADINKRLGTNLKNRPKVDIYPRTDWGNNISDITSIDSQKIVLSTPVGNDSKYIYICPNNRYVVKNFYLALDTASEWYQDQSTHTIYYMPPGGTISSTDHIYATVLDSAFSISGAQNIDIQGISFQQFGNPQPIVHDGVVTAGSGKVIQIQNSSGISVLDSEIANSSGYGIYAYTNGNSVTDDLGIKRNNIHDVGRSGIHAQASTTYRERLYTGNDRATAIDDRIVISNNIIHDVANQYSSDVGIQLNYSLGAEISHNEIYNLPRMGVRVVANNTTVTFNNVHETNRLTQDGASIYFSGRFNTRGNLIQNNLVKNTGGYGKRNFGTDSGPIMKNFGTLGIYFDTLTSGNTVNKNVVVNASRGCLDNNGGSDNTFTNNYCIDSGFDPTYGTQVLMSENAYYFDLFSRQLYGALNCTSIGGDGTCLVPAPDTYCQKKDGVCIRDSVATYRLNKDDYKTMYGAKIEDEYANYGKVRATGDYMANNIFKRNIFSFPSASNRVTYTSKNLGSSQDIDKNIFYAPDGALGVSRKFDGLSDVTAWDGWKALPGKSSTFDKSSKVSDVSIFSGPGDYSPEPSILGGLGIQAIDVSQVGPL